MTIHVDNGYIQIGIDNDILFFTYKNGTIIDLPTAIETVGQRLMVQDGKAFPVLCHLGGVKKISRLARIYLSRKGTVLVERIALLSTSKLPTAIAKFYLSTNVCSERVRFFYDENVARQFLRSF